MELLNPSTLLTRHFIENTAAISLNVKAGDIRLTDKAAALLKAEPGKTIHFGIDGGKAWVSQVIGEDITGFRLNRSDEKSGSCRFRSKSLVLKIKKELRTNGDHILLKITEDFKLEHGFKFYRLDNSK